MSDLDTAAYVDLVIEIDRALQEMSAWCERCPCHEHVQEKYKGMVPSSVARQECGEYATAGIPC